MSHTETQNHGMAEVGQLEVIESNPVYRDKKKKKSFLVFFMLDIETGQMS